MRTRFVRTAMTLAMVLAPISLAVGASACSDADSETASDGTEKVVASGATDSGSLAYVLSTTGPLESGTRSFRLLLTNADGSEVAEGQTLSVMLWMPSMGHGSHAMPTITALGQGVYSLENVEFTMPGQWELVVEITAPTADKFAVAIDIS